MAELSAKSVVETGRLIPKFGRQRILHVLQGREQGDQVSDKLITLTEELFEGC